MPHHHCGTSRLAREMARSETVFGPRLYPIRVSRVLLRASPFQHLQYRGSCHVPLASAYVLPSASCSQLSDRSLLSHDGWYIRLQVIYLSECLFSAAKEVGTLLNPFFIVSVHVLRCCRDAPT